MLTPLTHINLQTGLDIALFSKLEHFNTIIWIVYN